MAQQWIATGPGGPETWQFVDADVPAPAAGEVTIRVAAAGVNPADAKHVAVERGQRWPVAIGYEVAGTISAVGPGARIGSGQVAVGDEVLAFRVQGGYATDLTVDASRVFHKRRGFRTRRQRICCSPARRLLRCSMWSTPVARHSSTLCPP